MAAAPWEQGVPLPGHPSLRFTEFPADDLAKAAELETASYPADEAATPEKLNYRWRVAPELFYGVYEGEALIGFIVSTAAAGDKLDEESMRVHIPGGESVCIHSVVVAASHRRRGIARAMVCAYVGVIAADTKRCSQVCRFLLIAKADLCSLYVKCGFKLLGKSAVVHGADPWFDMCLDLSASRQLDFVQVDAFTPAALAGNPAAVLFTQRGGDEAWMQTVAEENNLSETAFLEERTEHHTDGAHGVAWNIRWFTPGGEVDLCGHATLGSAHALWDTGRVSSHSPIVFHTQKVGALYCSKSGPWIKMDFPVQPPVPLTGDELAVRRAEMAAVLSIEAANVIYVGRGPATTPDWLVEVSQAVFATMVPDLGAIRRIMPMPRGLIVTCAGPGDDVAATLPVPPAPKRPRILKMREGSGVGNFDFLSRFFAPGLGIDEDPVTGSAHCVLAPYWAGKLADRSAGVMQALQASKRGGVLRIRYLKDTARVEIEGQAVTVIQGSFAA